MKRPITLTIAAILVLVMILLSSVWPVVGGDRLLGMSTVSGRFSGGFPGGNPPSGNFQQGMPSGNFSQGTPPSGQPNGNQNGFNPNGQNQNGTGNGTNQQFQPGTGGRGPRGGLTGNRELQYVLYAVEFLLGVATIVGLWLSKRWGMVLAIITSAVVLIATIPGMFRVFSAFSLIESLLKILLAIGIIVLVVIPKPKQVQTQAL
jgi:hypothetical protein